MGNIFQLFLFISEAKPQKAARRIKVVKKEVASLLKKEHLNVTKAGETTCKSMESCDVLALCSVFEEIRSDTAYTQLNRNRL